MEQEPDKKTDTLNDKIDLNPAEGTDVSIKPEDSLEEHNPSGVVPEEMTRDEFVDAVIEEHSPLKNDNARYDSSQTKPGEDVGLSEKIGEKEDFKEIFKKQIKFREQEIASRLNVSAERADIIKSFKPYISEKINEEEVSLEKDLSEINVEDGSILSDVISGSKMEPGYYYEQNIDTLLIDKVRSGFFDADGEMLENIDVDTKLDGLEMALRIINHSVVDNYCRYLDGYNDDLSPYNNLLDALELLGNFSDVIADIDPENVGLNSMSEVLVDIIAANNLEVGSKLNYKSVYPQMGNLYDSQESIVNNLADIYLSLSD